MCNCKNQDHVDNLKEVSFISGSDTMEDGNEIYQQPTLSDNDLQR